MKGKDAREGELGRAGHRRRVFLWVCMSFCVIESDSQLPLCALAWRGECEVNTILWIKPDTPNTDAKQSRKHTLKKKKSHTHSTVYSLVPDPDRQSGLNVEKNQKCELKSRV